MNKTFNALVAAALVALPLGASQACVSLFDPLAIPESSDGGAEGASDGGDDASDGGADVGAECDAGAVTQAYCGSMCGTMTTTCVGGVWQFGPCQGEGACAWGAQQTCGAGGVGMRYCETDCTWGACYQTVAP